MKARINQCVPSPLPWGNQYWLQQPHEKWKKWYLEKLKKVSISQRRTEQIPTKIISDQSLNFPDKVESLEGGYFLQPYFIFFLILF